MTSKQTIKLFPSTPTLTAFYNELGLKTLEITRTLKISSTDTTKILKGDPLIILYIKNPVIERILFKKYHNYKINILENGCTEVSGELNTTYYLNEEIKRIEEETNEPYFFNSQENQKSCGNKYILLKDELENNILITFAANKMLSVGVLTSGGDCQGMNACLRSVVRSSIKHNITPYLIYEGYKGLIHNDIYEATWEDAPSLNEGGTNIKSARSLEFLERMGRLKATINIIKRGITGLVILGGDGSFKGGELFHDEWKDNCIILNKIYTSLKLNPETPLDCIAECPCTSSLYCLTIPSNSFDVKIGDLQSKGATLEEKRDLLTKMNIQKSEEMNKQRFAESNCKLKEILLELTENEKASFEEYLKEENNTNQIKVVCIPCTIDNDVPLCTSLGFNTALHRVIESVDNLIYTMASHNRAFVIEVMGRDCGYIAVMSGLALNANYVLCPEVQNPNWKTELLINILSSNKRIYKSEFNKQNLNETNTVCKSKKQAQNNNKEIIIILSEGAVDNNGPITAQSVKELLTPYIDTRVLTLGHLQRGGRPSAEDRLHGTLIGVKAVESLLVCDMTKMVCLYSSDIVSTDRVLNESNGDIHWEMFDEKFSVLDFFKKEYQMKKDEIKEDKWKYKLAKLEDINLLADTLKEIVKGKRYSELLKYRGRLFVRAIEVLTGLRIRNDLLGQNRELCKFVSGLDSQINMSLSKNHVPENHPIRQMRTTYNATSDNTPFYKTLTSGKEHEITESEKNQLPYKFEGHILASKTFLPQNSANNIQPHIETFESKNFENIITQTNTKKQIGIVLEGYRCSGMHIALSSILKHAFISLQGISLIHDGFSGLLNDRVEVLFGKSSTDCKNKFKALEDEYLYIGTSPLKGEMIDHGFAENIIKKLRVHKIDGLIIIGSSAAIPLMKLLKDISPLLGGHEKATELLLIPLSISSNIPLTTTIGQDTALNSILSFTDILSSTRMAFHNTVNLVELGGTSGYLCMLAGIASGAVEILISEKTYKNADLIEMAKTLKDKFTPKKECTYKTCLKKKLRGFECSKVQKSGLLILRQNTALPHVVSSSLCELLKSDSEGLFRTEYCVLGQLERGGDTSPKDRILSILSGIYAFKLLTEEGVGVNRNGIVSIKASGLEYIEIETVYNEIDVKSGKVMNQEWTKFIDLCKWLE